MVSSYGKRRENYMKEKIITPANATKAQLKVMLSDAEYRNKKLRQKICLKEKQYSTAIKTLITMSCGFAEVVNLLNDEQIEILWNRFELEAQFDDKERLKDGFFVFPANTHKSKILVWFDEKHSKGVEYLLNKR